MRILLMLPTKGKAESLNAEQNALEGKRMSFYSISAFSLLGVRSGRWGMALILFEKNMLTSCDRNILLLTTTAKAQSRINQKVVP